MSIFGIITICLVISVVVWLFAMMPDIMDGIYSVGARIGIGIGALLIFIGSVFVGIGINTENEKVFVKKYLAQKQTIEMSLEVEELSGLERIELVRQATELNGELAERKAQFELWYFVVYDNTIYDNVELINLNKKLGE